MKHSLRPRKTAQFSNSLQRQLNSYALAGSAAGVGVLALAQPAAARIIYTSAHKTIDFTHKIPLDLNHDGKIDFTLQETLINTTTVDEAHSLILSVSPAQNVNQVWTNQKHASALPAGIRIGPKGPFAANKKAMALDYYQDGTGGSGTCAGPWNNVKNRYLGLKFRIEGQIHFGWARLNVTCVTHYGQHEITGLLTGYAYETIPGKAIIAGATKGPDDAEPTASPKTRSPEPVTLGSLALGAPGQAIWRREETINTQREDV
jgi:hypothetical protein